MIPRRKKRLTWVISLIAGVAVAVSLILYALNQNIDLFYTPSEVLAGKGKDLTRPQVGQRIRVGGMVVEDSVRRDPQTLQVHFRVTDTGPEMTVLYTGILPDLFREGQGIVAQGILIEPDVLQATEVLAKHDEEYMPPELAEAMKGIKHVNPNAPDAYSEPAGDGDKQ
ncbi:cytochrome C biogenesis protein CcmE [Pseudidiomarina salinarum]|uniref:Cytochrome c-type biogenesis protein CcmE n=1 Tax=Pseudidiomarina salinarum TaxID=435908 RepID=A0A094IUQ4_9GAMM|nr:cytochrome c maturation protein CcmE [Pseudidiomarina salinarum]KFZ31405.1 cytochrome C biogenesis protein CcmE [Pseudidiomarina salinarum]RUO70836.1 cytochrome c maturation protein CcmE [Pseudidiomarina salinarum]